MKTINELDYQKTPHFLMDLSPTEYEIRAQEIEQLYINDSPCMGCKQYTICGDKETSCAASRQYELRGEYSIVAINTKIKQIK